jgi:hypothetical protein
MVTETTSTQVRALPLKVTQGYVSPKMSPSTHVRGAISSRLTFSQYLLPEQSHLSLLSYRAWNSISAETVAQKQLNWECSILLNKEIGLSVIFYSLCIQIDDYEIELAIWSIWSKQDMIVCSGLNWLRILFFGRLL